MKNYILYVLSFILLSSSCDTKKKTKPVFYARDNFETEEISYSGETIDVPYREENGVKIVAVKLNGMKVDMIFDTGCSTTLISAAEANYLFQKGELSESDILGVTQAQIADGSIVENAVVNLKEVIIDDKLICTDVQATVSNNVGAPLLLGNEILNRAESFTIDQSTKTIKFKLK